MTSTSPVDHAAGVTIGTAVKVTFDQEMNLTSLGTTTFQLKAGATAVAGAVTLSGNTATFTPAASLSEDTVYTAIVTAGVKSLTGVQLAADYSWSFTTGGTPAVISISPVSNATGVSTDATVRATFSRAMNPSTLTSSFTLMAGVTPVPGTVAYGAGTATFTPAAPLADGTEYRATITTGAKDTSGAALASDYSWSFTTAAASGSGVSGRITYGWVPAKDNVTEGGIRLDYTAIVAKPARRVVVQALNTANTVVAETRTDDDGNYMLAVPPATSVTVRVVARAQATGNSPDGIAPDNCAGANWDIRVVDNTNSKAQYMLVAPSPRTAPASGVNLHAPLAFSSSSYTNRSAAPLALLDTLVSGIERVCQGSANASLPLLYVNWSPNNVPAAGNKALGQIGTSHYTTESGVGNLYILGREDVDTDEYDDHVMAHELGHYFEDKLYRSDSIGGMHTSNDVLDPRVAFGEGYGNGFSAMVFNDAIYVDTSGADQATGFAINMNTPPSGNDRGVYSERSIQHLLWKLYDNRDATAASGSYDRIHAVLNGGQKTGPALTTGQSFAAYYNARFGGAAESLQTLWGTTLAGSYNSLCRGNCTGSGDTADPFDVDNDLGIAYATAGRQFNGSAQTAEFWRLYKPISGTGFAAPGDGHDVTVGNGLGPNKYGVNRWYVYVGTGSAKTIFITRPGGLSCPASTDNLDADLYDSGSRTPVETYDGCESINVPGALGKTYVVVVRGYSGASDVSGWGLTIN